MCHSILRDPARLSINVDAHDPFAVDEVRVKELFKSLAVGSFRFGEHAAPYLAGDCAEDPHLRCGEKPLHQFFQGLLGQAGCCMSRKVSRHVTSDITGLRVQYKAAYHSRKEGVPAADTDPYT